MKNIFFLLFIFLLLCSCSRIQDEDIYILYTNDVASELDGDVGYAGVKYYKDFLSSEHKYVALVDAGDFLDGDVSVYSRGEYIIQVMNYVGYDVVTLGNQEFSIGLSALSNDISESNFDYVSCNIRYLGNGNNPLEKVKPYVIKKFGSTKIAFIGVTTPETLIPNKPAYDAINDNGNILYSFYEDDNGKELYEQIQKIVNEVRKKVDYVIVLAHLGSNSVTEGFSSYDVIANTEGIDVLIDGHSHTMISGEAVANKNGEGVVLTSTGQKLENLGELVIHTDHTYTTTLYPSLYEKDEVAQDLVNSIYEEMNR